MHYQDTPYGFEWGAAIVTRARASTKHGWIILCLETPRHKDGRAMQLYVTRTGKVRVYGPDGREWKP